MNERRKEATKKVEVWGGAFEIGVEEIVCGVSLQGSFADIEDYKATFY